MDGVAIEHSLQQSLCGRHRRNIKLIEASTGAAIYFTPPFSLFYNYRRPGTQIPKLDNVIITAEKVEQIADAKRKLHELGTRTRTCVLEAVTAPAKIDSIMLHRIDAVRKIAVANATYIMLPPIGKSINMIRVQGSEQSNVQRTVREVMALVSFYIRHYQVAPGC